MAGKAAIVTPPDDVDHRLRILRPLHACNCVTKETTQDPCPCVQAFCAFDEGPACEHL